MRARTNERNDPPRIVPGEFSRFPVSMVCRRIIGSANGRSLPYECTVVIDDNIGIRIGAGRGGIRIDPVSTAYSEIRGV